MSEEILIVDRDDEPRPELPPADFDFSVTGVRFRFIQVQEQLKTRA
jgi:hypothetical protein